MASKQRADKQKEKEKREKIILIGLVAVLVVVGAIELPKVLKSGGSSSSAASSVAQTTSSSSTASSSATGSHGTSAPGSLPDSNVYKPGAGQLSGFSLFNAADPFGTATTSSSPSTSTTSTPTTSRNTKSTKTTHTTKTPHGSYVAARISVNGAPEDVALNNIFPADAPVFVLDSVSAKKIEISIAGGSLSSGRSKLAIAKGKSVTLVNTVDSTRYTIKFITPLKTLTSTSTSTTGTTGTTTTGTTGTTTTGTTGTTTTSVTTG